MKNLLGKKFHLGRFGVPMWTIGLAGVMVAAVAGQAVGPVLSGSVQGSAGLVVSQTVVLAKAPENSPDATISSVAYTAATQDDFAATMNDEGTAFTVALETQVGQLAIVSLTLLNGSGKNANFILELNAPAGIDVDADGMDNASNMSQLNKNTWLGVLVPVTSDANPDVKILVEPKDDASPGFYTITGRIIQVAN